MKFVAAIALMSGIVNSEAYAVERAVRSGIDSHGFVTLNGAELKKKGFSVNTEPSDIWSGDFALTQA
jgi:hypothetical protein